MTTTTSPGGGSASLATLPWERFRLVVFDVDGTLYDQRPLRRRMTMALLRHCLRHPGDLLLLRILQTFRRQRERLAEEGAEAIGLLQYERPAALLGLSPERVQQTVETWMHDRPLPYLAACRYAGVERVLDALQASGRITAVFSDYPAEAKLQALGLRADLLVAATDPDVQRLKPHPRGLQAVLERTGVPAELCLFIGDRDERDGACARQLGVSCLLKVRPDTEDRPGAFQRYDDLLPWLGDGGGTATR